MDRTIACLTDWISRQRWYGGKGHMPALREIGAWEPTSPVPGARVRTLLVMDDASGPAVLYQIPVVERAEMPSDGDPHLIGRLDSGTFLFDGVHDPAWTHAVLNMILGERAATSVGVDAVGHRSPADRTRLSAEPGGIRSHVLAGEQSNTSIVIEPVDRADAHPIIVKLYRRVHHGENPDVTLQSALTEAGSPHVPRSVGHVLGQWRDDGQPSGNARGHLVFAQEYVPDAPDAWRIALQTADAGVDFTADARDLGTVTAEVHHALASRFPTRPATSDDVAAVMQSWLQRLAVAIDEVAELEVYRPAIETVYRAAQQRLWPQMQRIHGDYHLGQVILAPDRGWLLLDFEGEPLRSMSERNRPDLALRDVAGMLRSFDYVAGSLTLEQPDRAERAVRTERAVAPLRAWADASRRAFMDGYLRASGLDLSTHRPLLHALELDKAVYEALYERRNRPDWLRIPLLGIERLLAREHSGDTLR